MAFAWTVDSGGTLNTNFLDAYNLESDGTDDKGTKTLTVVGSPSFVVAKNGNGLDQGSSNSTKYANIVNDNLGIDGGSISMSIWAKINTAPASGVQNQLVAHVSLTSNVDERITYWNNGGTLTLRFLRNKIGTATATVDVPTTLSTSAFTNLIHTYDGTTGEGWTNGVSQGTYTQSGGGGGGSETTGFGVGNFPNNNPSTDISSAVLDAVYVWSKKLSNTEVSDLYNGGTGSFYVSSGAAAAVGATLLMMGV